MPNLTIVTYSNCASKDLSKTERSLNSQTYRDFDWLVLNNLEEVAVSQSEYILFLSPGEILTNNNTLQKVFNRPHSEEIVFGNSYIRRFFRHDLIVGTLRDDISVFHMMEKPIPLSAAFLNHSFFNNQIISPKIIEPTHWLELLLSKFFLENCTIKHVGCVISYTTAESYKTMFNIEQIRQNEIIQTIMPRLVNSQNRLYSQSETNEALKLFFFLQRNKTALYFYNKFLKPKGGLDA